MKPTAQQRDQIKASGDYAQNMILECAYLTGGHYAKSLNIEVPERPSGSR